MTQEGYDQLYKELKHLRSEERYALAQRIEEARSFGDLSENAEYTAAKDDQAKLESRIQRLEHQLSKAKIIDVSTLDGSHVALGTTVTIEDSSLSKQFSYSIVGSEEANPKQNKISSISPVGQALMGKRLGDEINVKVPNGMRKIRITDIKVVR
ncbi:MAG: transcription elongation factor GreA [Dethiosulfovibrio peptidovorans]|nr:MAG: transcription elongation factor GreA [Dethiosulfovibrio peptidovorans]